MLVHLCVCACVCVVCERRFTRHLTGDVFSKEWHGLPTGVAQHNKESHQVRRDSFCTIFYQMLHHAKKKVTKCPTGEGVMWDPEERLGTSDVSVMSGTSGLSFTC